MSSATKARDSRIAAENAKIRSMPEIWVICAGNDGRFPYYLGDSSPLAACWESARLFYSQKEAETHLKAFGCPGRGLPFVTCVKARQTSYTVV